MKFNSIKIFFSKKICHLLSCIPISSFVYLPNTISLQYLSQIHISFFLNIYIYWITRSNALLTNMRHISRILQRMYDIYSNDLIQYELSKYNITSDNQFNHKFYEMNQKIIFDNWAWTWIWKNIHCSQFQALSLNI